MKSLSKKKSIWDLLLEDPDLYAELEYALVNKAWTHFSRTKPANEGEKDEG